MKNNVKVTCFEVISSSQNNPRATNDKTEFPKCHKRKHQIIMHTRSNKYAQTLHNENIHSVTKILGRSGYNYNKRSGIRRLSQPSK